MDLLQSALVVLSGAGTDGHVADPVRLASGIVGPDCVKPAGEALAQPWLDAGGRILSARDQEWPDGLRSLGAAAPLLLWTRGTVPRAAAQMVAIVGARHCTAYGREVTGSLARVVGEQGRHVVSGGAHGIDRAAHTSALDSGAGTVVVAAGGAGRVYPPGHEQLFERATGHGAVVWEYPPGTRLTQRGFLHRNRLIAAMASVTVVVEAAERSGALNTGRSAADLGRLVFGVPGRLDSPASAGVHRAIADGWAALLLGPEDLSQMTGSAA
ncbi:MAG: DNA-processing protein DprA [Candidatus Nanopelagicales bacterium]